MKKYIRHFTLAIQETLAFRMAYFVNMASAVIVYIVIFAIWNAVFSGRSIVGGYTWDEMKAYLIIALFLSALVSLSSEFRISRQIRTGNIVVELLRPVDYQKASLAMSLGTSTSEGLLVGAACLAFGWILAPSVALPGGWSALGFAAAVVLSILIKLVMVYLFGLVSFWTESMMGISWFRRAVTDFFSGALIPLSFFPDGLRGLADWLPFRSIVWVPASAFTGRLSGWPLAEALAVGAAWLIVLWFLARLVWARAMRKVTVMGG